MRPQVTTIQLGRDILVLGDAETLRGLPNGLRRRSAVCGVLRRMATDAHAMRQLRQYWASRSLSQPNGLRSDRELLEVVEAAVERGAVPAMVIPDHGPHVRDLQLIEPGSASTRAVVSRPVAQMTAEERLWEVVTRAAAKLPRATGEALLGLFTPENLAIAAGLAALSAAANLTPIGWAADAVMLAVAVGFGGLAAIQGLKDLVACFSLTANATTSRDLDEAATHLAKVVADFGVMWLMALLHERAKRGAGGGEGELVTDAETVRPIRVRRRAGDPEPAGTPNTTASESSQIPKQPRDPSRGANQSNAEAPASDKPAPASGKKVSTSEPANRTPRSSAYLAEADPAKRVLGSARDSHPEEIAQMRKTLDEWGVDLVERPNDMAYGPGLRPGEPGQMIIDPDASYSAWLHEFQHASDDRAAGWAGMRGLADQDNRWQMEQNAYGQEIQLMEGLGHSDVADELRANMEAERKYIYGE